MHMCPTIVYSSIFYLRLLHVAACVCQEEDWLFTVSRPKVKLKLTFLDVFFFSCSRSTDFNSCRSVLLSLFTTSKFMFGHMSLFFSQRWKCLTCTSVYDCRHPWCLINKDGRRFERFRLEQNIHLNPTVGSPGSFRVQSRCQSTNKVNISSLSW